jgi:ADP-dependent NAD(P)H-hydrate dehydratase / NAD(P)H-hydrate epimerase
MRQNIKRYKIISTSAARNFDNIAVKKLSIPSIVLMENAGKNIANIILEKFKPKNVAIFCGSGNNGGDGFVIARHLFNNNIKVKVFLLQNKSKYKGDALVNLKILQKIKISIINLSSEKIKKLKADLIVDALLGTGTKGEIRDFCKNIIEKINSFKRPVVSVDIPSGIDADSGKNLGTIIKATATVTMAAIKKGLLINDGRRCSGKIYVVDIGIKY